METDKNLPADETGTSSEVLLSLFRRTVKIMVRAAHSKGHAHHAQGHVMTVLKERGQMNQRELMELLNVRSASLSELLAKLERQGLIFRERDDQDRRNFLIALSEEGRTLAEGHEQEMRETAETVFAPLSVEERRQLGGILTKIYRALEETMKPDGHGHGPHGHGRCRHDHHPGWPDGHGRHGARGRKLHGEDGSLGRRAKHERHVHERHEHGSDKGESGVRHGEGASGPDAEQGFGGQDSGNTRER